MQAAPGNAEAWFFKTGQLRQLHRDRHMIKAQLRTLTALTSRRPAFEFPERHRVETGGWGRPRPDGAAPGPDTARPGPGMEGLERPRLSTAFPRSDADFPRPGMEGLERPHFDGTFSRPNGDFPRPDTAVPGTLMGRFPRFRADGPAQEAMMETWGRPRPDAAAPRPDTARPGPGMEGLERPRLDGAFPRPDPAFQAWGGPRPDTAVPERTMEGLRRFPLGPFGSRPNARPDPAPDGVTPAEWLVFSQLMRREGITLERCRELLEEVGGDLETIRNLFL
jgi:hypothetical protein